MSIDLARRAYIAAWKDAVTHPTRDMSPELAFEYWWQRELAMLEPLPVPLLDKETLQPLTGKHVQIVGRAFREVPPVTIKDLQAAPIERVKDWSKPLVGDNDGPYEAQGIRDPVLDAIEGAGLAVAFDIPAREVPPDAGKLDMGDDPSLGPWTGGVIEHFEHDFPPIPDLVDETWEYFFHPQLVVLLDGIPVPAHVYCKVVKRGEWADIYSKEHNGYARCNGNYTVAWAT